MKENAEQRKKYGADLSAGRKLWDILFPFVFIVLCMLLVTMAVIVILSMITGVQGKDVEALRKVFPGMALYVNVGFYGLTILTQRKNLRVDDLRFGHWERRWKGPAIGAGVLLIAAACALWSDLLLQSPLMEWFPGYQNSAAVSFEGQDPVLLILATVVLAPPAEEMIFRGMLFRRAENYMGRTGALLLSSFLFGLYHANMIQFLYAFLMGLLLAYLYEKSGTLLLPVLAHGAANLWNIISSWIQEAVPGAGVPMGIAEAITGAACLCFLLYLGKSGKGGDGSCGN